MKTALLIFFVLMGRIPQDHMLSVKISPKDIPEHITVYSSLFLASRLGPNLMQSSVVLIGARGPRGEERSYRVRYHFFPHNFPEETVPFEVVTDWSGECRMASKSEFPDCSDQPVLCDVNVSREDARRIAEENGLVPGIRDWEIQLTYLSHFQGLVWTVSNTTHRISQGYEGKSVIIRASDGEFLAMWGWVIQA